MVKFLFESVTLLSVLTVLAYAPSVISRYAEITECQDSLEYLTSLDDTASMFKNALNEAIKTCQPVGESEAEEKPSAWYTNLKIAKEDAGNNFTASEIAQIKKLATLGGQYLD